MSKKQAKSERDVDLPDWADEVTPADEVMKKFYAPTGLFRSGPIVVTQPGQHSESETASASTEELAAAPEKAEAQAEPTIIPEDVTAQPEPPYEPSHSIENNEVEANDASLPSSVQEGFQSAVEPPYISERAETRGSAGEAYDLEDSPDFSLPFEEFARRWKKYLYPGQLAVMRTLLKLTLARGTKECFIRYSEIALAAQMTRRNCINVMNSLVERGFVERLEVRNEARIKGIRLRVHIDPLD